MYLLLAEKIEEALLSLNRGLGCVFVAVHTDVQKNFGQNWVKKVDPRDADLICFVITPKEQQNEILLGQILTKEQVQQFNQKPEEVG